MTRKYELVEQIKDDLKERIEYLLKDGYELDEIDEYLIDFCELANRLTPIYNNDLIELLYSDSYTFWESENPHNNVVEIIQEAAFDFIYQKACGLFDDVKSELEEED